MIPAIATLTKKRNGIISQILGLQKKNKEGAMQARIRGLQFDLEQHNKAIQVLQSYMDTRSEHGEDPVR